YHFDLHKYYRIQDGWETLDKIYDDVSLVLTKGFFTGNTEEIDKKVLNMRYSEIYFFVFITLCGLAGLARYYVKRHRAITMLILGYIATVILLSMFTLRYRAYLEPYWIIYTAILLCGIGRSTREYVSRMRSKKMSIVPLLFLSLCVPATILGDILEVPSQYPTIQSAINNATNGDTILVAPGTYDAPAGVTFDTKANIVLLGETGREETTVSGHITINNSNHIVVTGFTIDGGASISCNLGTIITDCILTGSNDCGCTIISCPAGRYSNVEIVGNIICENTYHGIRAELSGGETSIRDNEIYGNGESGISITNSYGEILGNVIYDNEDHGIVIEQATFSITENTVARNTLSGVKLTAGGGAFTEHIAHNIVALNRLSGIMGDVGITAHISCNDVWANSPGGTANYGGTISDQTGLNGNISVDPYFCNVYTNDFAPAVNSQVFQQPCGIMGAFSEPGCLEHTSTATTSWGAIKFMYR
ncbi:MAG: right-handed parallel beta-helix repeat-containing protein, partial [candidate division WOR-3 bacterium]